MEQLSTYELLDLFATYGTAAGSHFMNFVTVFFAFVAAGYFIASKLTSRTYVFICVIYTIFMLLPATASFLVLLTAVDIADEIAVRQPRLGHNASILVKIMTGRGGTIMLLVNPFLQFVAYLGSIVFVHKSRIRGLGTDAT